MPSSQPFDMHLAAKRSAECGVDDDVLLRKHQAVSLARSLRGISAVTEVLAADTGEDDSADAMVLGDYLRVALIEAVAMLTEGAQQQLEQAQKNHVGADLGGIELN